MISRDNTEKNFKGQQISIQKKLANKKKFFDQVTQYKYSTLNHKRDTRDKEKTKTYGYIYAWQKLYSQKNLSCEIALKLSPRLTRYKNQSKMHRWSFNVRIFRYRTKTIDWILEWVHWDAIYTDKNKKNV